MYTRLIADSATFIDLYTNGLVETYAGAIPIAVPEAVFSHDCFPLDLSRQKQLAAAGLGILNSPLDYDELIRIKRAHPVVGMVDCITLFEANKNPSSAVLTDNHWILAAAASENIQTAVFSTLQFRVGKKLRQTQRRRRWYRGAEASSP